MVKKDNQKKATNPGFREKMTWEDCVQKLTPEDRERIVLWKEADEIKVKDVKENNQYAYQCVVRCDPCFLKIHGYISNIEGHLVDILSSKRDIEINKGIIVSGKMEHKFQGTDISKTPRDYDIANILLNRKVNDSIAQLWLIFYDIYRYIGVPRFDGKILITREQYSTKIEYVINELKKNNIDFYAERF